MNRRTAIRSIGVAGAASLVAGFSAEAGNSLPSLAGWEPRATPWEGLSHWKPSGDLRLAMIHCWKQGFDKV